MAGVSTRTIDYYTQIGILKEKTRTSGNHRIYSEDALVTIIIVKQLQEQHFSLDEICQLLKSNDNNDLIEITVGIEELLNNLQKKMVELYLQQRDNNQPEENKIFSRELIAKGLSVMQTLTILLGQYIS